MFFRLWRFRQTGSRGHSQHTHDWCGTLLTHVNRSCRPRCYIAIFIVLNLRAWCCPPPCVQDEPDIRLRIRNKGGLKRPTLASCLGIPVGKSSQRTQHENQQRSSEQQREALPPLESAMRHVSQRHGHTAARRVTVPAVVGVMNRRARHRRHSH